MEKLLISIIMPVYNAEKWIERSIDSLLNQTYRKFELILVLDNCTDNTLIICKKYADLDNRIKLYTNKKNLGVASSTNVGLDKSLGEIIIFMDHDDCYYSNALETIYNKWNDIDQLLIFGVCELRNCNSYFYCLDYGHVKPNIYYDLLMKNIVNPILPTNWAKAYSAEIIKKNNIRFVDGLNRSQDLIFNVKYLNYCTSISMFNDVVYLWDRDINPLPQSNFYDKDSFEKESLKFKVLYDLCPLNMKNYVICNYVTNCYILLKVDARHPNSVDNKTLFKRIRNFRIELWEKYEKKSFIKNKVVIFLLNNRLDFLLFIFLKLLRFKKN